MFAVHRGAQPLGIIVGPLLAAAIAMLVPAGHEAWRWAFVVLAVPGVILGASALRLPEPARERVGQGQKIGKIRTLTAVMISLGAFGVCANAVPIYLTLILQDHFDQGPTARGVIAAVASVGGVLGAAIGGVYGDRVFRRNPTALLYFTSATFGGLGIAFALEAYSPNIAAYVVIGALASATTFAGIVSLSLIVAAVTPVAVRSTAFALVGLYLALFGGLGGALITGVAEGLWGARAAVAIVAPVASLAAALVLAGGARHLRGDIAAADADAAVTIGA